VLIDRDTNNIAWAYGVRKGGAANQEWKAEAVAKHLKAWLRKQEE